MERAATGRPYIFSNYLLRILWGYAIMRVAKSSARAIDHTAKKDPRRERTLWGFLLPALAVPVKPFAHIIANYARSDRHKEID